MNQLAGFRIEALVLSRPNALPERDRLPDQAVYCFVYSVDVLLTGMSMKQTASITTESSV